MRNIKFCSVYLAYFFSLLVTLSYGQQELVFEHPEATKLLSTRRLHVIKQDSTGYLWFGTNYGLYRFDGYEMEVFTHQFYLFSISDNNIRALEAEGQFGMWVGTLLGGLNYYDGATGRFWRHNNIQGIGEVDELSVTSFLRDPDGTLWLGSQNYGLLRLHARQAKVENSILQAYMPQVNNDHSLATKQVTSLLRDHRGRLWVGLTKNGLNLATNTNSHQQPKFYHAQHFLPNHPVLAHLNVTALHQDSEDIIWVGTANKGWYSLTEADSGVFTLAHYDLPASVAHPPESNAVYGFAEDDQNRLWVATDAGVYLIDLILGVVSLIKHDLLNQNSLSGNRARSLFYDVQKNMWVGVDQGNMNLHSQRKQILTYRHKPNTPGALPSNRVRALYSSPDAEIWIGTNIKGGLSKLNLTNGTFKNYLPNPNKPGQLSGEPTCIFEDSRGNFWVGTWGEGLNRRKPGTDQFEVFKNIPYEYQTLPNDRVQAIFEDSKLRLWIATEGGLSLYDRDAESWQHYQHILGDPESLSDNRLQTNAIVEDAEGMLWLGTWGGGLNRFNPETGLFKSWKHNVRDPNSLSNNSVISLYVDSRDILWVGTYGGGLNQVIKSVANKGQVYFKRYTELNGLANNVIFGILEDNNQRLWLSTSGGLSCFIPETKTFRNFDMRDGLQGNEFYFGASCKLDNGQLAFGGTNGFNIFHPDELQTNNVPPKVVINEVEVLGSPYPIDKTFNTPQLTLDHNQNFFTIKFTALNHISAEKNAFAYKLEGFDKDWVFCGQRRTASYTNLDGGEYVFNVRAANNDGIWNNEGSQLRLTVLPPFWRTWWFNTFTIILLLVSGYTLFRVRTQRIRTHNEALQQQIATREAVQQELESKNAELERFTYTVSHDLKSPLVTIQGFVGLLAVDADRDDKKRMHADIEQIKYAADKMKVLLDELLELSRLGNIDNKPEAVTVKELLDEVLPYFSQEIEERNIDVVIQDNIPSLYADKVRLREVYQNLVENAVKYSRTQPEPKIEVGFRKKDNQVVYFVKDNGKGIDPAYQHKVFDLFERIDTSIEGTGVGLALVKRIIELHGGRIWAESDGENTGSGTTFYFTMATNRS